MLLEHHIGSEGRLSCELKRVWKEATVNSYKDLNGLGTTTTNFIQVSKTKGKDIYPSPPRYKRMKANHLTKTFGTSSVEIIIT